MKFEITYDIFDYYCTVKRIDLVSDSGFGRGQRPVVNITVQQAKDFCDFLSFMSGVPEVYNGHKGIGAVIAGDPSTSYGYRLPTESEWEYAAKGGKFSKGTLYSGSNDLNKVGWYWNNAYLNDTWKSHEVGQKQPNELGLYDMSGNVAEFLTDYMYDYSEVDGKLVNPHHWDGPYVIFRGGSWYEAARFSNVYNRRFIEEGEASSYVGFRVVRTIKGGE